MAMKRRKKRKIRRKSAAPLPASSDKLKGQREDVGTVLIGGAKDPAETAADTMAAQVLSGKSASVAGPASTTPGIARSESTSATIASGNKAATAPATAQSAISALGGGRPMATGERASFEPGFGRSFADVRIHEGPQADTAARSIDADAFTDGQNIAFAKGQNTPETMAHELAHVTRGDSGVRRKVITEIEGKPDNLRYKYKHDYGVDNVKRSGNVFSRDSAIVGSHINKEIGSAMLASERKFFLKGKGLFEAEANLRDHHKARRSIVKFVQNIRVDFDTAKNTVIDDTVKFIDDEARKRTADYFVANPMTPVQKADPHTWRNRYIAEFMKVFQENADSDRVREAADEVLKKSKKYDREGDPSAERPFAAACFMTTAFSMFASGGPIQMNYVPFDISAPDIRDTAAWTDWVPGDWGYVKNPDPAPDLGLEGENLVYVGNNKFWGHFPNATETYTLQEWTDEVASWNAPRDPATGDVTAPGTFELPNYRKFPVKGLL